MPGTVLYEREGHIATITYNRPEVLNAIDGELREDLNAAWVRFRDDEEAWVAIVTGAGRAFSAGADLRGGGTQPSGTFWEVPSLTSLESGLEVWKPVIAAVNGWAAGAGLYLLLASTDIRIASAENARFKFALLTQGWLGNGPGATLLARQLRYADAMRILLTDEPFDAEEALRIGLVNEVVPHDDVMDRAEQIAEQIKTMPPIAVRMMKEFLIRFGDAPTDMAWQVQNLMNNLLIQTTADGAEGTAAFNEKRPPNFTGAIRRQGEPFPEPSEEQWQRLNEIYRSGHY